MPQGSSQTLAADDGTQGKSQQLPSCVTSCYLLQIINMDDANKRKQLVTELRTLVGASCKQFVNMLDAFFHDGTVYIALEYMDGGSIDNIQKKIGVRMPEASLAFMLREMLVGLSVLHEERKQIHRDIKPGNLLFNSQGDVKLGDFGISKTLAASGAWGGKQQVSSASHPDALVDFN